MFPALHSMATLDHAKRGASLGLQPIHVFDKRGNPGPDIRLRIIGGLQIVRRAFCAIFGAPDRHITRAMLLNLLPSVDNFIHLLVRKHTLVCLGEAGEIGRTLVQELLVDAITLASETMADSAI